MNLPPVRWPADLDAKGWAWAAHRLRSLLRLRRPVPRPALLHSRLDVPGIPPPAPAAGPVRLLVCTHNLRAEGAPISLLELVAGLVLRGDFAVEVLAFEDGPLRARYAALGVAVQLRPAVQFRVWSRAQLDREVASLAEAIRASGAELVLANTLLCFAAVLAAEEADRPSVWIPRESEPWQDYFRFLPDPVAQRAIGAIGLPRSVVFVAEATRRVWQEFDAHGRFTVIPNGLDLSRFSPWLHADRSALRAALGWAPGETVFLCVGTVCERKGQHDLIDAARRLGALPGTPWRIVLAGDSTQPYARKLRDMVQMQPALHACVDFVPATPDIGRYLRACDAFVLSSRVESYPRVTLEAMAFGLPIVTTPVFGVAEQLHEDDALFYAPGDTTRLAGHLRDLAMHPQQRERLGGHSRAALARLPDHAGMCTRHARVLARAVGREGAPDPS